DLAAAKWAWQNDRPAGRGSDTLPGSRRLFVPMRTGRGVIGVIGVDNDKAGPLFSPDDRRLLDALIDQSALAIERVFLVEDMDKVKRVAETDRLRSALLTSISHDLKTPLAAILGSATTMRGLSRQLSDDEKSELLTTVIDESERLNRFIANLLDMTRLEAGAIAPNAGFYDPREIVDTALRRAAKILSHHTIEIDLVDNLPMIKVDPVLLEQALFNLLDNAAKYAPAGTAIQIKGELDGSNVVLSISDEGDGIPSAELIAIFDKFHRAQKGDRVRPGTGLGLAIARGFIEAMNGSIAARNRHDRSGAIFTIKFGAQPGESAEEAQL
ncbi:MAG: two-component sensor histidine kinase, partial [Oxalobacteraceae bacterium]